jgi:hypothetical protein
MVTMKTIRCVLLSAVLICGLFMFSCATAPVTSESGASDAAIRFMQKTGVDSLQVVRIHRIEAPMAGYIVDAVGSLAAGDALFGSFRVGISEDPGEPFVFFAWGAAKEGHPVWLVRNGKGELIVTEELPFDENEFYHWQQDSFDGLRTRP